MRASSLFLLSFVLLACDDEPEEPARPTPPPEPVEPAVPPPAPSQTPSEAPPETPPEETAEETPPVPAELAAFVARAFDCAGGDPHEVDEPCSFELAGLATQESADDEPESVAVLKILRGHDFSESHHIAVRSSGRWSAGPKIADGPWLGNQATGVMRFEVSAVELVQLLPDAPLELCMRYDTTTTEDDDEWGLFDVGERGFLACGGLPDEPRCARIADRVAVTGEIGDSEATASIAFEEAGVVTVTAADGTHARIQAGRHQLSDLLAAAPVIE